MTKILLIQDTAATAAQITRLLQHAERETFEVTCAATVADGVEQIAYEAFDAVLMELSAVSDNEFAELTHLKDLAPMLPVVLLCTHEDRDLASEALEYGAEDYVEEDHCSTEVLTRSIRYAIEKVDAAARLAFLSRNDPLTGLVNRTVFRDRVTQALARSARSQTPGALLLVDLDSFKAVNDTYGSDTGDALLQHVASQLEKAVRPYDVVARLGGDDFGILLEDVDDPEDVGRITQRVLETTAEAILIGQREIVSTASVGAAIFPSDGSDPSALLRNAGFALDRAKRQGGDTASFYMDVFGGGRRHGALGTS